MSQMIGVYDSGYGGLTILAALQRELPGHDFVYLGDNGRAPYGDRDIGTILDFAEQCVERLFEEGCRVIIVACHTVSCLALRHLQRRYANDQRRILGVTIPAAELAVATGKRNIGWMGTARTVSSRTPAIEIAKIAPGVNVHLLAAPLLAAIVEEGLERSEIAKLVVSHYLERLPAVEALVLGCTHYPLLAPIFGEILQPTVALLDPSFYVAQRAVDWLQRHPSFADAGPRGSGSLRVLGTGDPEVMQRQGERFLGAPLGMVAHVAEAGGRLAHRHQPEVSLGQIVR